MRERHRDAVRFQHGGDLLLARLEVLVGAFQPLVGRFLRRVTRAPGHRFEQRDVHLAIRVTQQRLRRRIQPLLFRGCHQGGLDHRPQRAQPAVLVLHRGHRGQVVQRHVARMFDLRAECGLRE